MYDAAPTLRPLMLYKTTQQQRHTPSFSCFFMLGNDYTCTQNCTPSAICCSKSLSGWLQLIFGIAGFEKKPSALAS